MRASLLHAFATLFLSVAALSGAPLDKPIYYIRPTDDQVYLLTQKGILNQQPFHSVSHFSCGLAAFRDGDTMLWGLLDAQGKAAHLPAWLHLSGFDDDSKLSTAQSAENRLWGFIDTAGRWVIQPQWDACHPMTAAGVTVVRKGAKWGLIDAQGNVVVAPMWPQVAGFMPGKLAHLCPVLMGDKWGYVDVSGKMVIAPQFVTARGHAECGLARASLDGKKWTFINEDGSVAFPATWTEATAFYGDKGQARSAVKTTEGKWGIINEKGAFVAQPEYDNASTSEDTRGKVWCWVAKGKLWGLLDGSGNEVIKPVWHWISRCGPQHAAVGMKTDEGWRYALLEYGKKAPKPTLRNIVTDDESPAWLTWTTGDVRQYTIHTHDGAKHGPFSLDTRQPDRSPILRVEAQSHSGTIHAISAALEGKLVLTAGEDKTARLWNGQTGGQLRVLRYPVQNEIGDIWDEAEGQLSACALDPAGERALTAGITGPAWEETVCLWIHSTETGRVERRIGGFTDSISAIVVCPDQPSLALLGTGIGDIELVNIVSGKRLHTLKGEQHPCLSLVAHGSDLYAAFMGSTTVHRLQVVDGKIQRVARQPLLPEAVASAIAVSPDGDTVLVGDMQSPAVSKLAKGSKANPQAVGVLADLLGRWMSVNVLEPNAEPKPEGINTLNAGSHAAVAFDESGTSAFLAGTRTMRHPTDMGKLKLNVVNNDEFPIAAISTADWTTVQGQWITTGGAVGRMVSLDAGRVAYASQQGQWGIIDTAQIVGKTKVPMELRSLKNVSFPAPQFGHGSGAIFATAKDKSLLITATARLPEGTTEQVYAEFELATRELTIKSKSMWEAQAEPLNEASRKKFKSDEGRFERGLGNRFRYRNMSVDLLPAEAGNGWLPPTAKRPLYLATTHMVRCHKKDGSEIWSRMVPGGCKTLTLSQDERYVIVASGEGLVQWLRADDGEPLLSLMIDATNRRWVLYTPQGYYDCSPGAEDLLGWHVNRRKDQAPDFFPASRLRAIYYRPDIIQKVLALRSVEEATKEVDKALGRIGNTQESISQVIARVAPPVVSIETGGIIGQIDLPTDATELVLRYRVRQTSLSPTENMHLHANGRPLPASLPIPVGDALAEARVQLPRHFTGELTLTASHSLARSAAATLRVQRQGILPAASRPKLRLIAIGAGQLASNQRTLASNASGSREHFEDLPLAGADARRVAELLQQQGGKAFESVETTVLLDQAATTGAIRKAIQEQGAQTAWGDLLFFYFAGHGNHDPKTGKFQIITYDTDPLNAAQTALSGEELGRLLAGVPGYVVAALDACHSGAVLGMQLGEKYRAPALDIVGLANQLSSSEQGIVVLSSSSPDQVSYEDDKAGGGIFTKVLLEGLAGKAKSQGQVRCSSLMRWLDQSMAQATRNADASIRQIPVSVMPQSVPDLILAIP